MRIGISTGCLYPELTEKSLKLLSDGGFGLFEIFFNTFSELEPDYLDRLAACCENAQIISLHPFTSVFESYLLFSGYERRFHDGLRMYDMYFRTAQRLGADFVVLHGMQTSFSSISIQEYCRRFVMLSEEAEKFGVTFLQENVYRHMAGDIGFIRQMKELSGGHAAFALDTKQARRCGFDPCELAYEMGSGLKHVHISDCSGDDHCLLPGKGDFDFRRFFDVLGDIGYSGDAVIEVYGKKAEDIPSLLEAKEYLEKILAMK